MTIESHIEHLITALDLNARALDRNTAAHESTAGCAAKPAKEKKTKASEPAQSVDVPDATAAAPAPAAAVTAAPPAAQVAGSSLTAAFVAEKVIALANEYSREAAVSILAKARNADAGVTRVSDLKPAHYQDVLNEVAAAVAVAQAAKANASLV